MKMRIINIMSWVYLQCDYTAEDNDLPYKTTTANLEKIMQHYPMSKEKYENWTENNKTFILRAYINREHRTHKKELDKKKTIGPPTAAKKKVGYKLLATLKNVENILANSLTTKELQDQIEFSPEEIKEAREYIENLNEAIITCKEDYRHILPYMIAFYDRNNSDPKYEYQALLLLGCTQDSDETEKTT